MAFLSRILLSHAYVCILSAFIFIQITTTHFAHANLYWWDNQSMSCNTNNARGAWGNPTTLPHAWEIGKGHNANMMPDKTFWIANKEWVQNGNYDARDTRIMTYMARIIVDHGGYFCPTQVYGHGHKPNADWYGRFGFQNPTGNWERTCFWLCEPGYTGEYCRPGTVTNESDCKKTWLTKAEIMNGISYRAISHQDGNIDSELISAQNIPGAGNTTCRGVFGWYKTNDVTDIYTAVAFLAAKEFLPNGHGIVASPANATAHGGMWNASDYSDEINKIDKTMTYINLTITANSGNYMTKILCMPGFDGPGCTSQVCKDLMITKPEMYNCYPSYKPEDFDACVRPICTSAKKSVPCLTPQKALGTKNCLYKNFEGTIGTWSECSPNSATVGTKN